MPTPCFPFGPSPHTIHLTTTSHHASPHHLTPSPHHLTPSPHHLTPSPHHLTPSPHHLTPSPHHLTPSPHHHLTTSHHHLTTSHHCPLTFPSHHPPTSSPFHTSYTIFIILSPSFHSSQLVVCSDLNNSAIYVVSNSSHWEMGMCRW